MHISRSNYRMFAAQCVVAMLPAAWAQAPANFISVTPCRVVDTRTAPGPLGGPSMTGGSMRSFPVPASSCGIPATASAYSLNLAVVPKGPLGYVTIWPTGQSQPVVSTLNDPSGSILANAAIVPAGTAGAISVYVTNTTDVVLDINGYFGAQSDATSESTALGTGASDLGTANTAVGFNTLQVSSGDGNTATGSLALSNNTSGNNNVAIGSAALSFNATGSANTGIGTNALLSNLIGSDNLALGFSALWANTTGTDNTAVGVNALFNSITASGNIALGYEAGYLVTFGANNIEVGNQGTASDSNVIRIGAPGSQITTFMAGINNSTVSGSAVLVDPNTGQLGIATSSSLYKEDIHDIGDMSDALMLLRPVTFRYKQSAAGDSAKPLQYGLIAEEVEKVYPELVVHGREGEVESVQYHEFPALLLNEVQKQQKMIEQLEARIAALEALLQDPLRTGSVTASR